MEKRCPKRTRKHINLFSQYPLGREKFFESFLKSSLVKKIFLQEGARCPRLHEVSRFFYCVARATRRLVLWVSCELEESSSIQSLWIRENQWKRKTRLSVRCRLVQKIQNLFSIQEMSRFIWKSRHLEWKIPSFHSALSVSFSSSTRKSLQEKSLAERLVSFKSSAGQKSFGSMSLTQCHWGYKQKENF